MDKIWLRLVILGVVILFVVVAWEVVLALSGAKLDRTFTVTEMSSDLYGKVEQHMRTGADFEEIEQSLTDPVPSLQQLVEEENREIN